MKIITLISCLFLLSVNSSTLYDAAKCTSTSPSKAKDCNNVYSKDAQNEGYHCCYYHVKLKKEYYGVKESKACQHYTKEMYDAIENTWENSKKAYEEVLKKVDSDNKVKTYEIKCQSSFLKIGFVGLIAALLL